MWYVPTLAYLWYLVKHLLNTASVKRNLRLETYKCVG